MDVGKELSTYDGVFSPLRTREVNGDETVVETTYSTKTSGDLAGTAMGTMTLSGTIERGTITELGNLFLDAGGGGPYRSQGVYWVDGTGNWQFRRMGIYGDLVYLAEDHCRLSDGVISVTGKLSELR